MRYRSNNINLKGMSNASLNLNGYNSIIRKNFFTENSKNNKETFDTIIKDYYENKDFSNLKEYIINTFITPLIDHNYEFLEENTFNIFYVLDTLESIKNDESDEKVIKEIEIFINIVKIFKNNITNKIYLKNIIEQQKDMRNNTLHLTTERISLKREYEIYIALYGYPEKNSKGIFIYEKTKLDNIKYILNTKPGCYYQEIKKDLENLNN